MPTVSPFYKTKSGPNPFYTMDSATITATKAALKRARLNLKQSEELTFRCVEKIKGKTIIDSRGQYLFQLGIKRGELPFGIKTTKKQITGHLGTSARKWYTAYFNNAYATSFNTISDQRIKTNVVDANNLDCMNNSESICFECLFDLSVSKNIDELGFFCV